MSEDTTVVIEEGKDKVPAGEGDIEEMVQLTPATYSALLDRLDELEASPKSKQSVDTLADAGTQRSRASFNDEDIENMRPKDLINAVIGHIEDTRIQPLLVRIEEREVPTQLRTFFGPMSGLGEPRVPTQRCLLRAYFLFGIILVFLQYSLFAWW